MPHCIKCMNFLTRVFKKKHKMEINALFDKGKKLWNRINDEGYVRIYRCKYGLTKCSYYLDSERKEILRINKCKMFDNASILSSDGKP